MILTIFSLLSFYGALLFGQAPATISGTIVEENGTPASAVFLTAVPAPPLRGSRITKSDALGNFTIGGLAAGTYSLCAQQAGSTFIDPCLWSSTPPKVTLSPGQQSSGNTLRLRKGQTLKVRINDPSHLVAAPVAMGGIPSHVFVGVWSTGKLFIPLTKVGEDTAGRDYRLMVPFDTPVKLSISNGAMQMTDANGVAIGSGGKRIIVQYTKGQPEPAALSFTIIGKAH